MKPKKIAIYSGAIPSSTFIERLILGLALDGFKVYLFGLKLKNIEYKKNIFQITYSHKLSKIYNFFKYSFLLFIFKNREKKILDAIIKSKNSDSKILKVKYYPVLYHKPDIFHVQWAKSLEDWIWVQDFGIKLVLSLRGTHITISPITDENLAIQYKKNFPKVNGFHAVSKSILQEAQNYGANLSKSKVIYSGLNLSDLNFLEEKKPNKILKIISVGRSHWVKGYTVALDAFAILKTENFQFQYTIIGIENDEELIFQRSELGLEHDVVFIKNSDFETIKKEIQNADFLLLPSLEEGIANVVLEAMALGTLVVSTNCGGMNEVITDGKNGFLVPIRNAKAISQKIKMIDKLTESEKRIIIRRARNTIEMQHDFESMISEMKHLYDDVLNSKN